MAREREKKKGQVPDNLIGISARMWERGLFDYGGHLREIGYDVFVVSPFGRNGRPRLEIRDSDAPKERKPQPELNGDEIGQG